MEIIVAKIITEYVCLCLDVGRNWSRRTMGSQIWYDSCLIGFFRVYIFFLFIYFEMYQKWVDLYYEKQSKGQQLVRGPLLICFFGFFFLFKWCWKHWPNSRLHNTNRAEFILYSYEMATVHKEKWSSRKKLPLLFLAILILKKRLRALNKWLSGNI